MAVKFTPVPSDSEEVQAENRKHLVANIRAIQREILDQTQTGSGPQRRNMNKECGYPDAVTLEDCVTLYEREGVAKRVVQVYPVETWKNHPEVYEQDTPDKTEFEVAIDKLISKFSLWSLLERADILSGIGHFGVILIGINDGLTLEKPVAGLPGDFHELEGYELVAAKREYKPLYFRVFDERQVTIAEVEKDPKNPRYGRPTKYRIKMSTIDEQNRISTTNTQEVDVHWHRIIHLADNLESSEIIGVPRLRPAYNRIHDLLKVIGGSGEMFWRGGFPGLSFEIQPGLQLQGITAADFDIEEFRAEVDRYANGLQRYLRLVGLTAKSLSPQVADPTPHVDTGLDQICITINCPKRIFLGTESAHLASTQDQKTWSDRIDGRRTNYAIPRIIRPVIYRLIALGCLPFVEDFKVHWKDPEEVDPLVRAQAFEKLVNGISQYASSGMATLIPPLEFLTELLQLTNEDAQRIVDSAMQQQKAPEGSRLPLMGATDELTAQKEAAKAAADAKAQQSKGSAATKAGPNGRKAGTGRKRTIPDVSTGQKGG